MGPARPRTGRRGGRRPGGLGGLRRGRHAGDLHDPGDRPARPGGAGGPGSRASGLLTGGAATSVWRGTEVAARPSGCLHGRVTASDTHRAVEAVWRIGAARLIAALSGIVRDAAQAQALAQDALVAALEQWPREGVPRNPGAWLMTVAKRRAVDLIRRNRTYERKLAELGRDLEDRLEDDEPPEAGEIEDDLLRLVFTACHPVLPAEARVALTLRVLGGLSTGEIARAFLMSEPAVAQRIVRAKRTLAARKVPFEVPILLREQNRAGWARLLIRRGLAALERAGELSGDLGPYTLQAEIAACHARAFTAGETDWVRIADLYARLAALSGSPVVELNRAVALAMAYGPGVGLELVDQIAGEPALKGYHLLPGVRGDLLFRLGRLGEAGQGADRH